MEKFIRQELRLSCWKVQHARREDFSICFFQKDHIVSPIWLGFKAGIFLYFLVTFPYVFYAWCSQSDLHPGDGIKCLLYLPYWMYILELVTTFLGFLVCLLDFLAKEPKDSPPKILSYVYWCTHRCTLSAAIVTLGLFWINRDPVVFPITAANMILIFPNTIILFVEWCVSHIPYKIFHFYISAQTTMLYLSFLALYCQGRNMGAKGVKLVYPWFDCPEEYVDCLGVFLLVSVVHFYLDFIFFIIYVAKERHRRKYVLHEI